MYTWRYETATQVEWRWTGYKKLVVHQVVRRQIDSDNWLDISDYCTCGERHIVNNNWPRHGWIATPGLKSHIGVFLEKRPLTVKFRFHRDTDRRVMCKFREIWPTGNQWNRASLPDKKQQNFAWLSSCHYCTHTSKICQGQPSTMYLECSRFQPNRFTYGVNTTKTHRKVNLIFGWNITLSRIITCR